MSTSLNSNQISDKEEEKYCCILRQFLEKIWLIFFQQFPHNEIDMIKVDSKSHHFKSKE